MSTTTTTHKVTICTRCECEIEDTQPVFVQVSCEDTTFSHQRYSDCVSAVAEADRAAAEAVRDLRQRVMIFAQSGGN